MPLIMNPPTYLIKGDANTLHPTTGLCTRLLGSALDYWALHSTTGLLTRLLGFSPDDWAFHPTTGLFTRLLGFASDDWAFQPTTGLSPSDWELHQNDEFLTQIPKSPHSTDQRTFMGYFPLKPGPLLMAYSHIKK